MKAQPVPNMTAAQLVAMIEATRVNMTTPSELLYPSVFFRHDIFVVAPEGQQSWTNPKFCARDLITAQLCQVLQIAGLNCVPLPGRGNPSPSSQPLGGGWSYTDKAGWLSITFAKGVLLANAGSILDFFNHGYPPALALSNAVGDLLLDAADNGLV